MTPLLCRIQKVISAWKNPPIPNWEMERHTLRGYIKWGKICKFSQKKLAWYLVVLANAKDQTDEDLKSETERFATIIGQLIQIRISQRAYWLSWVAVGVSIVAAVITWIQVQHELRHDSVSNPQARSEMHSPPQPRH